MALVQERGIGRLSAQGPREEIGPFEQAQGDLESLQARGRRVARVTLDELQEV